VSTVEGWIGKGYLRAVPVGARCYLVTRADCGEFAKPHNGRSRGEGKAPRVRPLPLSRFGLVMVKQFAEHHGRVEQTVLRWIVEEGLPVIPVPGGI
jgi:hypothetical protein